MIFKRGGFVLKTVILVTVVVIIAGCGAAPAPTQQESGGAAASPTAAPTNTATASGAAQLLDGAWEGKLSVAGQELGIVLSFKGQSGTIDIPVQNAKGIRLESVAVKGNQVNFEMLPEPNTATFSGTIEGDKMSGDYEQSGYKGTWSATRQATAAVAPAPAKGYQEEEITFKNGQYSLGGTLSLPAGPGPHPAVILISGSGAQNRDEELFGFKPFAILADALTKQGIAVLRYDDRGIGASSTGTVDDSSETYAADVGAAVDFLKTRSDVDPKRIGLLGHSEGGIIAPMVAVNKGDVAFLVLLGAPGLTGKEVLREQVGAIAKANGADQATIDTTVAQQDRAVEAILTGKGLDELKAEIVKDLKAEIEKLPESQRQALGDPDEFAEKTAQVQVESLQGAWVTFFLAHDPAPVLEKVDAPVLALFGGKDVQVLAATNEPAVKAALAKGGNNDVTTKTFQDVNHLFQAAQTGSPKEYASLKPEFAPGVLETITDWVVEQTK